MNLNKTRLLTFALTGALLLLWTGCAAQDPPAAGPPPSDPLPGSMKGYELYSWQVRGAWYFTLITGTNRNKTLQEIRSPETQIGADWVKVTVRGADDLEATLKQLPPGASVAWLRSLREGGLDWLAYPPAAVIQEVQAYCQENGIDLVVIP